MSSPEDTSARDSRVRLLPAREHRRVAWKNGLGYTMEVAVSPAGASYWDFDWRISIAELSGDTAFSNFPGIDRIVTLLSPGPVGLSVDGVETWITQFKPYSFAGDIAVSARLPHRRATDLNVMTRRDRIRASVRIHTSEGALSTTVPAGETSVCIVLAGRASLHWQKDPEVVLGERDAVIVAGPGRFVICDWLDLDRHQVRADDERPRVVFAHIRLDRVEGHGGAEMREDQPLHAGSGGDATALPR